jgi:hypothetical protein
MTAAVPTTLLDAEPFDWPIVFAWSSCRSQSCGSTSRRRHGVWRARCPMCQPVDEPERRSARLTENDASLGNAVANLLLIAGRLMEDASVVAATTPPVVAASVNAPAAAGYDAY